MKIKATRQIIDWDAEAGAALILNVGDEGDLSDAMLAKHEGSWEPAFGVAEMCAQILGEDFTSLDIPEAGEPPYVGEPLNITDAERADLPHLHHDGDGEPGGSLPDEPPALTGMNKNALIAQAAAEGITVDATWTKAEIIAAIETERAVAALEDGFSDAPVD